MAVVTISRQYGSGGLRVAPAIAQALGWTFVGRELTEQAALRLGVDPEMALARDERVAGLIEEAGLALAAATPDFGFSPPPDVDDRTLAEAVRRVILSLADTGGCVIMGRGSQAVLADRDDACHLSLVGDPRDRALRIMRSQGVDRKEAAARCERVDSERVAYVKRFHGRDIRDPLLYDCVLNTSRLGLDRTIDAALAVVRRKLDLPEGAGAGRVH